MNKRLRRLKVKLAAANPSETGNSSASAKNKFSNSSATKTVSTMREPYHLSSKTLSTVRESYHSTPKTVSSIGEPNCSPAKTVSSVRGPCHSSTQTVSSIGDSSHSSSRSVSGYSFKFSSRPISVGESYQTDFRNISIEDNRCPDVAVKENDNPPHYDTGVDVGHSGDSGEWNGEVCEASKDSVTQGTINNKVFTRYTESKLPR